MQVPSAKGFVTAMLGDEPSGDAAAAAALRDDIARFAKLWSDVLARAIDALEKHGCNFPDKV